jgi:hypothetical protein
LILLILLIFPLFFYNEARAQSTTPAAQTAFDAPETGASGDDQGKHRPTGSLSGTVVDQDGAVAVGATIKLTHPNQSKTDETRSGDNGQYSFSGVAAGQYLLTVSAPGFEPKIYAGTLQPGQVFLVPDFVLTIMPVTSTVQVELSPVEVAEQQVKEQEQQRVFKFFPNFYVNYLPNAAPLIPRQKFQLAWKSVTDPVTFLGAATLAGIYQGSDEFSGYGQGAEGYGKRLGAAYADVFFGTFLGSAAFPSLLHQDPRYFYRGPESKSRFLYAIGNAVMCKGDNGKYQPNYSAFLGAFAAGGISYLYYPASDRDMGLVAQNALVRIAEGSVAGIVQEFLLKRFTSRGKKSIPTANQP